MVLIVWDTVRAYNLSINRYPRTTPNLERWAQQGVRYQLAVAPAPLTYPSHGCFFTGQWPYKLNSQWNHVLDSPDPTLAEYLTSRGYQTAGLRITNHLSYESGLDRGFTHFDDYPLSPWSFFGRTAPGYWIIQKILSQTDLYTLKWFHIRSRDARAINDAFLDWLHRRRPDRPFFAFLNYYDAHALRSSPRHPVRSGRAPQSADDYRFLHDFDYADKDKLPERSF